MTGNFKLGSSAALLEVTSRADPPGASGRESLVVPAVTVRLGVTVPGTATVTGTGLAVAAGGDHATMLSGTARTGIPGARAGQIRNPSAGDWPAGALLVRRTPAVAGYAGPDQARPAPRGVPLASHGPVSGESRPAPARGGMRPAGASPIMMQKGACADSESESPLSESLGR